MSDGMNKVLLMGNLGADPELRFAASGTAILQFRMATNESYLDRNRELAERTEWHTVVVFGARAEGLSRVLAKGSQVLVEGALRTSKYEKDGQTRYKTEIHAREICLGGGPGPVPAAREALPRRDVDDEIGPEGAPPPMDEAPPLEERPERAERPRPARRRNGAPPRPAAGMMDEMPF